MLFEIFHYFHTFDIEEMSQLNMTNIFYRNSIIILASSLLAVAFMSWHYNNEVEIYLLFLSIFCFMVSYRFSHEYKFKNSPANLIKRNGNMIEFSRLKTVPFVKKSAQVDVSVSRMSTVNIGRNCLSVIIDGNGNGYDFQLVGSDIEIKQHVESLFTEQERLNIDIKSI